MDQFRYAFDPKAMIAFLDRIERNQEISTQFMANEELRKVALDWMMKQVFTHFDEVPANAVAEPRNPP